jgi:hypothetical protein
MLEQSEGRRKPDLFPVAPSSRSPHVTYLDRIDPLHEIEFKDVVSTRWDEISVMEHALAVSPSGSLVHRTKTTASPVSLSAARLYNPLTIRSVAALTQFHQLSTHQLITLSGGNHRKMEHVLQQLYSGGLIQRSTNNRWTHADKDDRLDYGVGDVWQLNSASPRLPEWFDGLTDLEYLLMSGGRDMLKGSNGSSGSSSIRHNLTLAEIIIRAIEMCPGVIGGWGEPMTVGKSFTESLTDMRANIADGAIIGKDGSVILIETSGAANLDRDAVGKKLSEKALAWAAIAARSEVPLKVIFENISTKARMQRFGYHIQSGLERIDEQIVKPQAQRKGRESIFIADALDWFPFTLGISRGFTEVEAYSTETRRYHSLVPADTKINPDADVVANTLAALHIPPWIAH